MGELDIAAKLILQAEPRAVLGLALPGRTIRSVQGEDGQLPMRERRMDKVFRLDVEDDAGPRWAHIEVEASWASSVPKETFDYWSRAHQRFTPLRSLVLVLKPGDKQGSPRDRYVVEDGGKRTLEFEYDLICAWRDLDAEELVRSGPVGLLPLVPYARGTSEVRIDEAIGRLDAVEPRKHRADLQGALVVFAGNVYPHTRWVGKIPKEILMESTAYDEILAIAMRQAERDVEVKARAAERDLEVKARASGQRRLLSLILEARLGGAASSFVARLEKATAEQLEEVAVVVGRSPEREAFVAELDRLLPPTT